MANVLVLCTGNSCRSQMAQAYLQAFLPEGNQVYSAGVDPKPVNPLTIRVMAEDGFDISNSTSNHIDELAGIQFAWILTVCDNAQDGCPIWVRFGIVFHQHFQDPSSIQGSEEEQMEAFRKTRAEIKAFCKEIGEDPLSNPTEWQAPKNQKPSTLSPIGKGLNGINRYIARWFNSRPGRFA